MKLAVVTRADSNIIHYTCITHPLMREFAEKWGADFIVFDHDPPVMTNDDKPHFRIMRCHELYEQGYDRIVFLDSDMLILPACPNPFEEIPEDVIGSVLEDKGSRANDRRQRIKEIQEAWGDVGWHEGYMNSGFLITSRTHQPIFQAFKGQYWLDHGSDDVHLGYQIHRLGFTLQDVSYKWNHMSMFSEPWHGKWRFDSYIIHYAGGQSGKLPNIRKDLAELATLKR